MSALVNVEDLTLTLPDGGEDKTILHGISFHIDEGESVGIVGESGSGKTMTIRSLMRLLPKQASLSGVARFDGRDILSMKDAQLRSYRRSDVGMIFQDANAAMNPVRTIRDFLTEAFRKQSRAERERVDEKAVELLSTVGIRHPERVLSQYPHQLSGGMLQRIMIASVLIDEPRLILADEPTTALDVTTQADVVAHLEKVRRERGISMAFISHDIELVAAITDRILVMYQGRILEDLTPDDLFAGRIKSPYTTALLECRPNIDERVHRLPAIDYAELERSLTW